MNAFSAALDWLTDPEHWSGGSGVPALLLQHVLLTATSLVVALCVALPVALWLGHLGKGGALAINISNIGRAIPTFAVLILLAVGVVGSGVFGPYGRTGLATLIALVVFALPPIVTNAYVGMREVDRDTVEAARGMGMRGWQLFTQVELPLAIPLVMAGVRLAVVQVWATATLAALVDGPGLGNIIVEGFGLQNYGQVLAGAVIVAGLALLLEVALSLLQRAVDPLRSARRQTAARTAPATST
ncbi:MAG TPA: ABC transporter permease [Nocardioidaceae bacterium]|jgi:osmoprotectant transport system permease protein|nr:ABC transporter permease [Nocardioidaceae bacterium]